MENIKILAMEYEVAEVFTDLFVFERVNVSIRVKFALGLITGELNIPIEKVGSMDEQKVKHFIYNYLNTKLERKFIDEI